MGVNQNQLKKTLRPRRSLFHFDVLLLAFLFVGWWLIFTAATLGLQQDEQQWLAIGLVSHAAADYSVNTTSKLQLAPINPEIIEAVKQDEILALATPVPAPTGTPLLTNTPIPTLTNTSTPTNSP